MHRTDARSAVTKTMLALLMALLIALPVAAEEAQIFEGEPTDPEKTLVLMHAEGVDLEEHGLAEPTDDADDSWFDALVKVLQSLGLLPQEARTE